MYQDYFGFSTLPFSITPDPRFFYDDNPSCREAFAVLRYGIEARKGFVVITGEAGTGKTTLLKAFVESAKTTVHTAFVINPKLTVCELLRLILKDLGIAASTQDRGALTLQLNDYLFEQFKRGHVVALLVDEAQQMSNDLLEELRLLSNLETQKDKLIQIVLVGQPELEERLDQSELRQLKQRVALRCRLTPLNGQAAHHYIQSRLKTAGLDDEDLFERNAVEKITLYSGGIPRLINVICDNALLSCYALSRKKVSAEIIEEVASDLRLTAQSPTGTPQAPINSETAVDRNATESQARITKKREQRGPAELKDVLITGYEPSARTPRRRNLVGLRTGLVFGVLVLAGSGAIFYSRLSGNAASGISARGLNEMGQRENAKPPALDPGSLQERPAKEPGNLQTSPAEKPLLSTQQSGESRAGSNITPSLEPSKTQPSQAPDLGGRSQENQTAKNVGRDAATETAAKRPGETPGGVGQIPANDRLRIDVNKAIANRAIRGIEVQVIDGTVVLEGRVATESQKNAAAKAARSVPGVKNIRDQIIVNDDVGAVYDRVPSEQTSSGG
jgi:general secretion pathway protein A